MAVSRHSPASLATASSAPPPAPVPAALLHWALMCPLRVQKGPPADALGQQGPGPVRTAADGGPEAAAACSGGLCPAVVMTAGKCILSRGLGRAACARVWSVCPLRAVSGGAEPQPDPALGPLLLGWAWAEHSPTWGSLGAGPPRRWDLAGPPQSLAATVHSEGGGMGPPAALGQSLPLASPRGGPTPLPLSEPHPEAPQSSPPSSGPLPFISSTPGTHSGEACQCTRGGFSQIEVPSRVPPRAEPSPEPQWRRPRAAGSRGAAVWGCPARGSWWPPRRWHGLWGPAQDAEAWRPWRRRVSSGGWVCSGSAPPTAVPPRLGRSLPGAVTNTVVLAACLRDPRLGHGLPRLLSPAGWLAAGPCPGCRPPPSSPALSAEGSISPGAVFLVSGAEPASTPSLPFFMSLWQGLGVLLGFTCLLWGKGFACPFLQPHSPC